MDSPLATTGGTAPAAPPPQKYCPYCGAPLVAGYYFCLTCATPHRDVESVLPRLRPKQLTEGELIAKKAPHVAPVFWTYFAVIVCSWLVCLVAFQERRPELAVLLQSFALFVTTCVLAARHWPSLAVQFRRFGFNRPAALAGLLALPVLLGVNYVYHTWVIEVLGVERASPFELLREAGFGEPALIFFVCICPAVIEEIAFRGLLQHWLHVAVRPLTALALASGLFMAMHFSAVSAPYLFAVGMLLGWTKWKTRSLYPSMLIHFLHNLIVLEFFAR